MYKRVHINGSQSVLFSTFHFQSVTRNFKMYLKCQFLGFIFNKLKFIFIWRQALKKILKHQIKDIIGIFDIIRIFVLRGLIFSVVTFDKINRRYPPLFFLSCIMHLSSGQFMNVVNFGHIIFSFRQGYFFNKILVRLSFIEFSLN